LVKIYFLIIFSVSILIYFIIVETISSLKNLNNALNDYYDYNEDNDVLKEKKIMMEAFIKEYFQMSQKDFNNYPDIVFSKKVLNENINIVRLIAKGKLGNVNNFEFFILLYLTIVNFIKRYMLLLIKH
jgi:hypothetical protein